MSTYCNCCSTDEQWVTDHLNWDVTADGTISVAEWTEAEWTEAAQECADLWASQGFPVECDVDELARLLRRVYGEGR
jgi:DNA-directed RNA polymerase alpha subunit